MKKNWILVLFALPIFVFGEVVTTDSVKEMRKWADSDTLCVFDLNDTLMQTEEYLGSDTWAANEIAREMEQTGKTKMEVFESFIPLWHSILINAKAKAVEDSTAEVVRDFQAEGIPVIGLTARYTEMAYPTHDQLQSIGIDLSKNNLYPYDKEIEGGYASKFIQGIIFVGLKNDKGETLFRFLDSIGYHPKKLLFADDKMKNVESVRKAAEKRGVSFTGIHYTYVAEHS